MSLDIERFSSDFSDDDQRPFLSEEDFNPRSASGSFKLPPLSKKQLYLGYIFFLLLGVTPQLMQNAIFSETPVFRSLLDEGNKISAYIVSSFMFANLSVLIYLALQYFFKFSETFFVYVILIGSLIDGICVLFFWDESWKLGIFGTRAVPLLLMTFLAGSLGNTATLVFFSFASQYSPIFTTALSAGFGMGGFFTTMLSVIQFPRDYPDSPNFGVFYYFLVIVCMIFLVVLMFFLLRNSPFGRSLEVIQNEKTSLEINKRSSEIFDFTPVEPRANFLDILKPTWMYFLGMFWVALITFIVPCVIPFMADNEVMTGLNGVFLVFPPVGAFLAGIYQIRWASIPTILQTCIFIYIILPILSTLHGKIFSNSYLILILMILFAILNGYNISLVYILVRGKLPRENNSTLVFASRCAAISNQVGALMGVVLTDVLIESGVFESNRLKF